MVWGVSETLQTRTGISHLLGSKTLLPTKFPFFDKDGQISLTTAVLPTGWSPTILVGIIISLDRGITTFSVNDS